MYSEILSKHRLAQCFLLSNVVCMNDGTDTGSGQCMVVIISLLRGSLVQKTSL